ncbi:MAG: S41 family peptidase [Patescibacteria group bacterium]|jgi:carboxyl-terminal processing protease|nr:S41 family peptidase [Patescibacteria group bacterium]
MSNSNLNNNSDLNQNYHPVEKYKKGNNFFWILIIAIICFYFGAAWKNSQFLENDNFERKALIESLTNPSSVLKNTDKNKPEDVDFSIFWEAWNKIDRYYVDADKLDSQKRVYGAIEGMIEAVGDPYSGFMDPETSENFNSEMEGSFEGIGAELGVKDEILTVISPIDNMPAQAAGIRAGDKILKINDETTADISIDEAVKKIRGPKGTDVTLTIVRLNGDSETKDITITRDTIELKSVLYEKKDDNIGYIRINKFAEDTAREFNKEITKAIADNSKGLIIDVRNNPGGYLNISIEIASKFIPKGDVVVWEMERNGKKKAFKALGGAALSEIPVVVLINEGSASASEILAGALRDNKGSKLIGAKSFGKGSVQQVEPLKDDSNLRITIAKWLTPSGASIHETGLSPDIEVELSDDDIENENDVQLQRAIDELKNQLTSE